MLSPEDFVAVTAQLGREPRSVIEVAHRCTCGQPDVLKTSPRLEDGTPFPTMYYMTCPRATGAIGTLEANNVMKHLADELAADSELAADYAHAHEMYLAEREAIEHVAEIAGISAGGMPTRVKCLHVLIGHSLAAGPGVNPLGDRALAMLKDWGLRGPCGGDEDAGSSD
ncbi:MAG: DUF501 domain-containing protein [Actinomycetes bacterium]